MSVTPLVKELITDVVEELGKVNSWKDIIVTPPNRIDNLCILALYYTIFGDIHCTLCDYDRYADGWKSRNGSGYISVGWWMPVNRFPVKVDLKN